MKTVSISSVIDCLIKSMMRKEERLQTKALLLRFKFKRDIPSYYRYLLLFRTDQGLFILKAGEERTQIQAVDLERHFRLAIYTPVENNLPELINKSEINLFDTNTKIEFDLEEIRPLFINQRTFKVTNDTLIFVEFKNGLVKLSVLAE